jgi:hypothetical protein
VGDPRSEYAAQLAKQEAITAAKHRAHIQVGNAKLVAVAAALVVAYLSLHRHSFSAYWLLSPLLLYVALAIVHELILRAHHRAETVAAHYRKGIARIDDRWPGTGQTGERFRDENHVYADDLDLFGRGSLFELLSTARLPMGENRLARWLKTASTRAEILERQTLITELRTKLNFHEDLAIRNEDLKARLNPESLVGWAEALRVLPGSAIRAVATLLGLAAIASFFYSAFADILWPILAVLAIEAVFRQWLLRRAESVLAGVECNAEGLLLFADTLQHVERESFTSPHLQTLAAALRGDSNVSSASVAIRRLARIVFWIDAHHSLLAHILELPLLYTVQAAFAAEAWRARYGARLGRWIDVAAEMEALLSLATYSFEHPADPFPELLDESSSAYFSGDELGHPLIPAAKCVRNSVTLDSNTRVILISGSNMSGKSTLLRTVGINTVLAMAGAPVRAKSLRLSPLTIGTRIRSTDSLQQGRSTFFTEILHIRRVFDLTESHHGGGNGAGTPPLLFLFDELLEGTNSHDRRIGAERLIQGLLQRGAIGMVTTHDLALTEISEKIGNLLCNMHFEDQVANNEMHFDYKLREGVVTRSNALELMRIIGLDI